MIKLEFNCEDDLRDLINLICSEYFGMLRDSLRKIEVRDWL